MNSRRSLVFLAGGALLGLLLAGHALFTARGTSTLNVPPEDVALVNQQPISRTDYLQQLQTLYGVDLVHATPEQRRRVLDDMIREELFVQRGKELDVASTDPEVRAAMVNAVEQEIAADAITAQPTEAQLRAYYALHGSRYSSEGVMHLRDFVFAPDDLRGALLAAEALAWAGPTQSLLAQWHASELREAAGEEFYFAAKIHLGDSLFAAAKNLSGGRVSVPMPQPDGVHVLYMVKNTRPVVFDFGMARDRVLRDYRDEAISRLRGGDETFLRKRANVLIADDVR